MPANPRFHAVDAVTLTAGPIARAYLGDALAALDAARTGGRSRGTVSIAPFYGVYAYMAADAMRLSTGKD